LYGLLTSSPAKGQHIVALAKQRKQEYTLHQKKVIKMKRGVLPMMISYFAARTNLSALHQQHPDWRPVELAVALQASVSWVKKWLKSLREEQATGVPLEHILQGHSRARLHPSPSASPVVVAEILAIRDHPPEGLRRVPGQEAIHYYLERSSVMTFFQLPVPSHRTIYRILRANQRIATHSPHTPEPQERAAPMQEWQLDFKDVSSVPADPSEPSGKQQHVVETLNILDIGTSVLLDAHVRADFTAETALQAVAKTLSQYGCPQRITVDRDPRWAGSPSGSDFPAALLRFGACVGIEGRLCAPHHPQQNGFVERYHRTYQEECLALDRPATHEQAQEVTEKFMHHYNMERPHQGLSCGNRPPRVACAPLPPLPPVPATVDPDRWLEPLRGT
jgi:transposase InsO family protein